MFNMALEYKYPGIHRTQNFNFYICMLHCNGINFNKKISLNQAISKV